MIKVMLEIAQNFIKTFTHIERSYSKYDSCEQKYKIFRLKPAIPDMVGSKPVRSNNTVKFQIFGKTQKVMLIFTLDTYNTYKFLCELYLYLRTY